MNISGWVTFKEIIDSIQLAWGDASDQGQFMRLLNFAIKGYEDLRLRHIPATKPVTLDICPEMRVVILPGDYLKFVSIGVFSDGIFYAFKPKSDAVTVTTSNCGITDRNVSDGLSNDGNVIERWAGYYTIDLENRRIIIDAPLSLDQVILNYTPTGIRMDGLTYIPRMCRMVIETYVEYQWSIRNKGFNMAERITFEKEYLKELMKFRGLQFNADEIFQEYYDHLAINYKF